MHEFFFYSRAQRNAIIILSILIVALLLVRFVLIRTSEEALSHPTVDQKSIEEIHLFMSTLKSSPEKNEQKKKTKIIPAKDPFQQKLDRIEE